jgi:hypothetical protein
MAGSLNCKISKWVEILTAKNSDSGKFKWRTFQTAGNSNGVNFTNVTPIHYN